MSLGNASGDTSPTMGELQEHVTTLASSVSSLLPSVSHEARDDSRQSDVGHRVSHSLDESVMTKEERVYRLVEGNDGWIYQSEIVASTDWSAPMVSQTLGEMEQEGSIVRYKVGREKVVCHPKHVPECAEADSSA